MREWAGEAQAWRREIAAAVLLGLFLGVLGPFGSWYNTGLALRLAYWVGIVVVSMAIYGLALRAALGWGDRLNQPTWFILPLAVLIVSAPMSALTAWVVTTIWPGVRFYVKPFDWYAEAVVISLPLSLVVLWSHKAFPVQKPIAAPPSAALTPAPLFDRLPGTWPKSGLPADGGSLRQGAHRPGLRSRFDAAQSGAGRGQRRRGHAGASILVGGPRCGVADRPTRTRARASVE